MRSLVGELRHLEALVLGSPGWRGGGSDIELALSEIAASMHTSVSDLAASMRSRDGDLQCRRTATAARRLAEECMAAVIGRIDAVRLVAAYKGARAPDYQLGSRNESSISWAKDVLPKFTGGSDPWSQATIGKPPGVIRGLLDGHLSAYVVSEAHDRALDALDRAVSGRSEVPGWVISLQKYEDARAAAGDLRSRAGRFYSLLSKGVHFEFSQVGSLPLRRSDLLTGVGDALYVCGTLGLYSHYVAASGFRLPAPEAARRYVLLSRCETMINQVLMP